MRTSPAWRVVLVRPQGPINIGLVSRACMNLGVSDLRLVAPACDPNASDARKFANHALPVLEGRREHARVADAVADCELVIGSTARRRHDGPPVLGPRDIDGCVQQAGASHVALVFGSESAGLTDAELRACDVAVHLPGDPAYPSFNLSHAVAIILYAARRPDLAPQAAIRQWQTDRSVAGAESPPASHATVDKLHALALDALHRAGYFERIQQTRFAPKLRRLLGQRALSERDAQTLGGILVHLRRALGAAPKARDTHEPRD